MEHMSSNHTHEHHEHTSSREELLALLSYLVDHNEHHCQELSELSEEIHGEASNIINEAITRFDEGNKLLAQALETMKKGE